LPGCLEGHRMLHRMELPPPGQHQPTTEDNSTTNDVAST
jgi:hypothetical protein